MGESVQSPLMAAEGDADSQLPAIRWCYPLCTECAPHLVPTPSGVKRCRELTLLWVVLLCRVSCNVCYLIALTGVSGVSEVMYSELRSSHLVGGVLHVVGWLSTALRWGRGGRVTCNCQVAMSL